MKNLNCEVAFQLDTADSSEMDARNIAMVTKLLLEAVEQIAKEVNSEISYMNVKYLP